MAAVAWLSGFAAKGKVSPCNLILPEARALPGTRCVPQSPFADGPGFARNPWLVFRT